VRTPISGLIGAKEVSIGDLVGKGSPTLLATVSKLDPIWFYCNVSEVQFLRAEATTRRTGQTMEDLSMELILSDGTVHPAKGKFVFTLSRAQANELLTVVQLYRALGGGWQILPASVALNP
jgi:membrane fusion protein (multidrug efflux system)